VRLGAGANSFGHARGRKNKAFTAFSASPRHDFSSAFPTEPAVVGRVSDGQIRALNRSRLDSVPNTVGEARGVPTFCGGALGAQQSWQKVPTGFEIGID